MNPRDERGPLVYCAEGADNGGKVWNLIVSAPANFTGKRRQVLDEPVIALSGEGSALELEDDGLTVQLRPRILRAIPYYTWANRDNYEMQVWLSTRIEDVKVNS